MPKDRSGYRGAGDDCAAAASTASFANAGSKALQMLEYASVHGFIRGTGTVRQWRTGLDDSLEVLIKAAASERRMASSHVEG
jgi:hypothetical protein